MQTLVLDFETAYGPDFTLKKLANLLYIRDPRFHVHGAGIKEGSKPAFWVTHADLPRYFAQVNWAETASITHNSNFDNTILFEKYGHRPARRIDTLALCRALLCQDLDFDLDTICTLLGLGGKLDGGAALVNTYGIRHLTPELEAGLARYAIVDAEREYDLFNTLYPHLPEDQAELLDLFIEMSTEGVLKFNQVLAREGRDEIEAERYRRLQAVGLSVDDKGKVPQLSSREKFAQLLRDRGVAPPMKLNAKGQETYAFSKQDPAFIALLNDPNAAGYVKAKLAWSSNSAISRVDKLAAITRLAPHTLPVQLNFSGAHTHRPSGGGGINMQNLNRGSKLRRAIHADDDDVLVVVDQSQIELRVNMWNSKQEDMVEKLRAGEYVYLEDEVKWDGADIYLMEAIEQYKRELTKADKNERNYGKVVQLMLGFGAGAPKFRATCAIGPMGIDPILISDEQSYTTVQSYRQRMHRVKGKWDWNQAVAIPAMTGRTPIEDQGVVFEYEAVRLPSGLCIHYPNLTCNDGEWTWGMNGIIHRIYGGKLQENLVQALAQEVCKYFMLKMRHEFAGIARIVHQVHDEIIILCKRLDAAHVMRRAIEIMSEPPWWCPDLPVRAEGGFAQEYSK
jgi:hypothetical protein